MPLTHYNCQIGVIRRGCNAVVVGSATSTSGMGYLYGSKHEEKSRLFAESAVGTVNVTTVSVGTVSVVAH